jgi:hypothetical protein
LHCHGVAPIGSTATTLHLGGGSEDPPTSSKSGRSRLTAVAIREHDRYLSSAGDKRGELRIVPCHRRRRRAPQSDRRGDRPPPEHSSRSRPKRRPSTSAGSQCSQAWTPDIEHAHPCGARLEAGTAWAHRRSRSPGLFRSVAPGRRETAVVVECSRGSPGDFMKSTNARNGTGRRRRPG